MIEHLTPPIRAVLIDLDGVLWRGSQPIGNLPEIFTALSARNLGVMLLTNNATQTAEAVRDKLLRFGVQISSDQIVSSAMAVAFMLKKQFPDGGPVYIIGSTGLYHALEQAGFWYDDESPLAVVVGLDRGLTYEKLRKAALFIGAGKPFFGANPDTSFPEPEGLAPGAGAILALLEATTGVKPLIAGKPQPALFELALERLGTRPEETLMIGDRLDTDILGGQRVGCRTALVLTGVSKVEEAERWSPPPDLIAPDLTSLLCEKVES